MAVDFRMINQSTPEEVVEYALGQVVLGRTKSARDDDPLGIGHYGIQCSKHVVHSIGHHGLAAQGNP